MTTTPSYGLTLTLHTDPPLDDNNVRDIGRRVTDNIDGARIVMTSHGQGADDDAHLASWTVLAGSTDARGVAAALAELHRVALDAVHALGVMRVAVEELSATSDAELTRKARARERAQLVGVDEFCEMLARPGEAPLSRSRFYELVKATPGFPEPVRPGRWTRHQAEAAAAELRDRPGPGRPPLSGDG
ncbi:hypothetical protein [Pseudonocardia sp. NPDC049635]|uniref:hypothetical protein n=1 Tax=Pseudonocardia sp. NPDC049635 TaxID=3155506 RepID=UPI003404261C